MANALAKYNPSKDRRERWNALFLKLWKDEVSEEEKADFEAQQKASLDELEEMSEDFHSANGIMI